MVEDNYGYAMVDTIIENSDLPSQGVYTAVGTYSFAEMLSLLQSLSAQLSVSIDDLLLAYGMHFFDVVKRDYHTILNTYKDPMELLASVHNHIHIEVRKIYPDAELPDFITLERTDTKLVMLYKSNRSMYNFGLGLMRRTFDHFGQKAEIHLDKKDDKGTEVIFNITTDG